MWDVFGATAERRMERNLRDDYLEKMRKLADQLTPATHELAVRIAEVPDQIRGFGHVKEAAVRTAAETEMALWQAYAAARISPAPQPVAAE
jgi:indolepyruvate ferredoxin oxidoreductase